MGARGDCARVTLLPGALPRLGQREAGRSRLNTSVSAGAIYFGCGTTRM